MVFASVDDIGAAILVAADGEREAEGKDQADDSEQRTLQGTDRLAIPLGVRP